MALHLNIFLCCKMQMDGGIFCFSSAAAQALFMPMFLRCLWFLELIQMRNQQESLPSAKYCCWLRKKTEQQNCSPYFFCCSREEQICCPSKLSNLPSVTLFTWCQHIRITAPSVPDAEFGWFLCFVGLYFSLFFYLLRLLKGKGGIEMFALLSNLQ